MFKTINYWMLYPIIKLYSRILKMDVQRHEKLPKGGKLIVANHPTTSDPFLVSMITRQPSQMLIIYHAFQVPVFGTYLRTSGHIPVVPGQGKQAFEKAQQHLRKEGTLILFPEGTLSPRAGGLAPAHSGAARLALSAGVPVIPMGIHLDRESIWYIESQIKNEWTYSRCATKGPYGVTVGKALHFDGDAEDHDLVHSVRDTITENITALMQESRNRITPQPESLVQPAFNLVTR